MFEFIRMKNYFLVFTILCVGGFSLQAQSLFEEYQSHEDVSYLSINPMMFKLLGQMNIQTDDTETAAYLEMIQSITNFKVLMTGDSEITRSIDNAHKQWVRDQGFELLLQLNETDHKLKFYVVEGENENKIKRLLMFSCGNALEESVSIKGKSLESVLLLLEGDIDLEQIGDLTEAMDLPGGDQLKKIQKW